MAAWGIGRIRPWHFFLLIGIAAIPACLCAAPFHRVLVLNSYHQGLQWTDNIVEGIEKTFAREADVPIDLQIEYLDGKHFSDEASLDLMASFLIHRYGKRLFDVVVISDDLALKFIIKYGRDLFGDTPVVFCGVNDFHDEMLQGRTNITGVTESFDVLGTLRAAMKLQPRASRILIVNDATITGQANRAVIERLAPQIPKPYEIEFLQDYSMPELQARLGTLDTDSIVLLMTFNRDRTGKVFNYDASVKLVTMASKAPVYGVWDFFLGRGIVGGMVTSGFDQGQTAARMALNILAGVPVSQIPVVRQSPNRYIFDYNQLKRFRFSVSSLPVGSLLINRPYSFMEQHQTLIIILFAIFIAQSAVIAALLRTMRQRKRAEAELNSYREHLEHLVGERTAEMVRAKEQAESANRAKSTFLANMSHDLRTPLNAIVGLTGVVLKSMLSAEQRDRVNKIRIASRNLVEIINDILDVSKVEAGRLELDHIAFDLNDSLETMADLFSEAVVQKDLELILKVAPDVPRGLKGDPARLSQVLTNLIQNAVRFTKRGEIVVGVRKSRKFTGEPGRAVLIFHVRDTGSGIAPDMLPNVFDAFTQADSSMTRRHGGTGLGLAICQRLVKLMGGDINVRSMLGYGSIFTFSVVLEVDPRAGRPLVVPADLHLSKVLAVSPSPSMRRGLEWMLRSFGLEASAVADGGQALERLHAASGTETFKFVILDLKSDGANGITTAAEIAFHTGFGGRRPFLIILAAGENLEMARHHRHASRIDAFITKPLKASQLFNTIVKMCGQAQEIAQPPAPKGDAAVAGDLKSIRNRRILVVDDNALNREVAKAILENAGLRVDLAEDGEQALAMLNRRDRNWFAVLMDIQMPGMDGFQTTVQIRSQQRFRNLPIIALTAHALKGEKEKCLAAGMNDFIPKPFEEKFFYQVLLKWLMPTAPADDRPPAGEAAPAQPAGWFGPASETDLLDVSGALRRLGGNRQLYLKLLDSFLLETKGLPDTINHNLSDGDLRNAKRLAHTAKGSAATIGASALADAALRLEESLGAEENRVDDCLSDLRRELDGALKAVKAFLSANRTE